MDRNQPVSQRSELSSRTTLFGEQPNHCDLLQPQDVMSQHRGAKQRRRFGHLNVISLLSPAYLLSDEQCSVHLKTLVHYDQLTFLFSMFASQSGKFIPLGQHFSEFTVVLPRYYFEERRPSETICLILSRGDPFHV